MRVAIVSGLILFGAGFVLNQTVDTCNESLELVDALDTAYDEAIMNRAMLKTAVEAVGHGDSHHGTMGVAAATALQDRLTSEGKLRFQLTTYLNQMNGRDNALAWMRELFQRELTIPSDLRGDLQAQIGRGISPCDDLMSAIAEDLSSRGLEPPAAVERETEIVLPRMPKGGTQTMFTVERNRDRFGTSRCGFLRPLLK